MPSGVDAGLRRPIRNRTLPDKLAGKGIALSGFSFGAMVFAMGFFQDDLANSAPLVFSLLFGSVLFLTAAEIADYSLRLWEFVVAETLYTAAALLMFGGFAWFIAAKFEFFGWPPLLILVGPAILYVALFAETIRSLVTVGNLAREE